MKQEKFNIFKFFKLQKIQPQSPPRIKPKKLAHKKLICNLDQELYMAQ